MNGSEGKALHGLCQRVGWKALVPGILAFLTQQKPAYYYTHLSQIVTICEHLCCDLPALSKERRAVVEGFCTPRFEPLRQLFGELIERGQDLGASLAVTVWNSPTRLDRKARPFVTARL
jgi:hypothetical protein